MDRCLAFSTANENAFNRDETTTVESMANDQLMPVFEATVQAVEEAIINAMVAAETMEGINGNKAYALPHDLLINLCGSKVLGVKYILNQSNYESIMADTTCFRS